jgi:sec-independent protein translocase protein TatB
MFDIGFWELSIIGIVMLLVVGPEQMPGLARKAGLYIGKARSMISDVKAEVEREINADEMKAQLDSLTDPLAKADNLPAHEIIEETKAVMDEFKSLSETDKKKEV